MRFASKKEGTLVKKRVFVTSSLAGHYVVRSFVHPPGLSSVRSFFRYFVRPFVLSFFRPYV